jgi:hypothetical protein
MGWKAVFLGGRRLLCVEWHRKKTYQDTGLFYLYTPPGTRILAYPQIVKSGYNLIFSKVLLALKLVSVNFYTHYRASNLRS